MILDELRLANWQRTEDGAKNRRRPKPISPLAPKGASYGQVPEGVDQAQVIDLLARLGPQPEQPEGG